MFNDLFNRIPWHRLKRGWAEYQVQALGTGLPFAAALVLYALVELFTLHVGMFFVGLMVACEVEAWAFHARNGAVRCDSPGGFWCCFGFFGVLFLPFFSWSSPEHAVAKMPVVMETVASLSLYALLMAIPPFVVGVAMSDKDHEEYLKGRAEK